MSTPRTRPVWPAYLISSIALFCAGGGPAYAGSLITGADIKDGSVTSADVRNETLKTVDVKDGTLTLADLSETTKAELSDLEGACPAGTELRWLEVGLTAGEVHVDDTLRMGRCVGTGTPVMGNMQVEDGEECDSPSTKCGSTGQLIGVAGADFNRAFD